MKIIIAIFILAALVLLVWPALQDGPGAKPNTRVAHELASLRIAANAYRMEFGQFPTGNVSQVCMALAGHNPRQIIFILFPPEQIQPDGAFLDP